MLAVTGFKREMAGSIPTSTNIPTIGIVVDIAPLSSAVFCQTVSYPRSCPGFVLGQVVTPAGGRLLRWAGGRGGGDQDQNCHKEEDRSHRDDLATGQLT